MCRPQLCAAAVTNYADFMDFMTAHDRQHESLEQLRERIFRQYVAEVERKNAEQPLVQLGITKFMDLT